MRKSGDTDVERGAVRRRKGLGIAATIATAALIVFSVPSVANAVTYYGFKGCPGQFGWMSLANSSGSADIAPPGTDLSWFFGTPGSRVRVATYTNRASKPGGGSWYGTASPITSHSAYCQSFG